MGVWYLNAPLLFSLSVVLVLVSCVFYSVGRVSCAVRGSGSADVDGVFVLAAASPSAALYRHMGQGPSRYTPDVFQYTANLRAPSSPSVSMVHLPKGWLVTRGSDQQVLFFHNSTSSTPPSGGWRTLSSPSSLRVSAHGVPTPSLSPQTPPSNLQQLLSCPVTTALLLLLVGVAYMLWEHRVPADAVSFSYEAVVGRQQLWRTISASFAHFDLLHLGMNCMALWQFRGLEQAQGSLHYLCLTTSLVVLTMAACVLLIHLLKQQYPALAAQQAVGYSCVLFALLVLQCSAQEQMCPLGALLPSPALCLRTYRLRLPLLHLEVAVNLAPLVLLAITQLIMPRYVPDPLTLTPLLTLCLTYCMHLLQSQPDGPSVGHPRGLSAVLRVAGVAAPAALDGRGPRPRPAVRPAPSPQPLGRGRGPPSAR